MKVQEKAQGTARAMKRSKFSRTAEILAVDSRLPQKSGQLRSLWIASPRAKIQDSQVMTL
jgi:hypothetical protein